VQRKADSSILFLTLALSALSKIKLKGCSACSERRTPSQCPHMPVVCHVMLHGSCKPTGVPMSQG
jgi:hypothetical protein